MAAQTSVYSGKRISWGLPSALPEGKQEFDQNAEAAAMLRKANITEDEVQRRYIIAGGALATSVAIVAALRARDVKKYMRLVTILPNMVAAAFFNSAQNKV